MDKMKTNDLPRQSNYEERATVLAIYGAMAQYSEKKKSRCRQSITADLEKKRAVKEKSEVFPFLVA